jgi:hypothetical protein
MIMRWQVEILGKWRRHSFARFRTLSPDSQEADPSASH